jgi:membrane-associated PAP2 superfamily phosphatase
LGKTAKGEKNERGEFFWAFLLLLLLLLLFLLKWREKTLGRLLKEEDYLAWGAGQPGKKEGAFR